MNHEPPIFSSSASQGMKFWNHLYIPTNIVRRTMTGPHAATSQRNGGHAPITKTRNMQIANQRQHLRQDGPNRYSKATTAAPVASGPARKWQIRNSS